MDLIYDLDKYPYPFDDNTIDKVRAIGMVEHIKDLIKFMGELHRICKNNAEITITAPHYRSVTAFADPTHKSFFTPDTFDYFTDEHKFSFYTKARFEIIKKELRPNIFSKYIPKMIRNKLSSFIGGLIQSMYFELVVIK